MKSKQIRFSKKALVIVIVVLLVFTIGYLFNRLRTAQKTQERPAVAPFEQAKYEMLPLLQREEEASLSGQSTAPPPRVYTYWKATVAYLPLPDLFVGSVDSAESLTEYRLAKKLIVAHITEKGINVCDLNIFWFRPEAVAKEDLTPQDVRSDGCP